MCVLRFETRSDNRHDEGICVRIRSLNIFKKTTHFAQKTYRFILSCDHGNIETVLLSGYHGIDNIVTSLLTIPTF